jgi:hypothetical protein
MAKLSQLTEIKLLSPILIRVKGETRADPPESSGNLRVHVAIVQGQRTATVDGTASGVHPEWEFSGPSGRVEAGPAQAIGLTVELHRTPLAFQTFTWAQEVQVLPPDAGGGAGGAAA